MIQMKKYIYLLTIAALAAFGCTPEGPVEDANKEYPGNKTKVTLEDVIPATGGSVLAIVKSEVPFTVSTPESAEWLTVDEITDAEVEVEVETEVDGVPVLDVVMEPRKIITFTATANNSAEMRYASVALIDSEKNIAITRFDVYQDGREIVKKDFAVSTTEINVEPEATTATFKVTGDVVWSAKSSNEAFVVTPASGEGEADVTVTFPANTTPDEVVAEIVVDTQDPGARPNSYLVKITQAGAKLAFDVSTTEIAVEPQATTATFQVSGEVAWTITSSNPNYVVSPAAGEGDADVTVTFPANTTAEAIVAELTVATENTGAKPQSHTIVLTHATEYKVFNVTASQTSFKLGEDRATIVIESEVDWTLTSTNEMIYLIDPADDLGKATVSGSGNAEILVLMPANFKLEENKSTITASTEYEKVAQNTYTFEFVQAAYTVPAGQVLAEWYFATEVKADLEKTWNLPVAGELADVEGFGDVYVDANSQGSGKFQYWQVDKTPIIDKAHKRCKRTITGTGEPMALPTYTGDYALWTANSASPLAAGTKVHIFFAVRPNDAQCAKYWILEYLDGGEWKAVADQVKTATTANGSIEYTHETLWDELQINTFVDAVVTLTASTSTVQFRFRCVDNTMCDGTPWGDTKVNGAWEFRFAGYDSTSNEKKPNYRVYKRPVIEVVQ